MFFSFANPASPGKRAQKIFMNAQIERREFQPFLQISEYVIAGFASGEPLEQRRVAAAKLAALRGEPGVESGIPIDLEAVEELTVAQGRQCP